MKMRLADFVADYIADQGVTHLFTVTGGGAMHLNDAFGHHQRLRCIYNHHEQASAMAAEGYARIAGVPGVCCVTTGPGGTNALTGVLGAWLDSIPLVVISGQVKYETTVRSTGDARLRQLGDQEFDITRCAATMTKYAEMVSDPARILYHLQKAFYLATHGRPGPVWLDIPLNVQAAAIETDGLAAFSPGEEPGDAAPPIPLEAVDEVIGRLRGAKRPVIYIGNGIHLARAEAALRRLAERLGAPVAAGFGAQDIVPYAHPLYVGRPGTIGDRAGNFAVQNADLLLILGCRLNVRQLGYQFDAFARCAYKVMVDVDESELRKPTLKIDLPIQGDVAQFIGLLLERAPADMPSYRAWVDWCMARKKKYPVVLPAYRQGTGLVNPYCFMEELGEALGGDAVVVAGNATACICSFQAMRMKEGQRIFSNSGAASMGHDLPAAIGAAAAAGRPVVCLAGDGSLQMNVQELQTVAENRLPVKLFILNNNGYHSIRQTQTNYFSPPLVGCEPGTGVSFPDYGKVAAAYGLPFVRCRSHEEMGGCIAKTLRAPGPAACEVMLAPGQPFAPRSASRKLPDGRMVSRPLEDLAPFLDREEYRSNLLIPEWQGE